MNFGDTSLNAVIADIAEHYQHACDKHPYFADKFYHAIHGELSAGALLECARIALNAAINDGCVDVFMVLNCEILEIVEAYERGDMKQAREECLDAIAVLMRMIDVIDGLQPLGNPDANKPDAHKCPDTACPHNDSRGVCLHKGGTAKCFKVEGGAK